jgi:hypothetical protein
VGVYFGPAITRARVFTGIAAPFGRFLRGIARATGERLYQRIQAIFGVAAAGKSETRSTAGFSGVLTRPAENTNESHV